MAQEGTRVELISSTDIFTRLRPGEQGTVNFIDSQGTLHVIWDNGSKLGLIPGEDHWLELVPEEDSDVA